MSVYCFLSLLQYDKHIIFILLHKFYLVKQEATIQLEKSTWDNMDEENLLQDNLIESNHKGECDKCDKCVTINAYGK